MGADTDSSQPSTTGSESSTLPIACTLDAPGMREQGERYAALGATAESIRYSPQKLEIEFPTSVDRALMAETLAAERRCCPFLDIKEDGSLVTIRVAAAEHDPVLVLMRDALRGGAS